MSLKNKTLAGTYKDLLDLNNSNSGASQAGTQLKDGAGNSTVVTLGKDRILIKPNVAENIAAFQVQSLSGTTLFYVDTVNQEIRVGASQTRINTAQHIFSTHDEQPSAGYWYPLVSSPTHGVAFNADNWGNSSEPASGLNITANSEQMIPIIYYTSSAIKVTGCDVMAQTESAATIDARLYKYTFVTGSGASSGNTGSGTKVAETGSSLTTGDDRISTSSMTLSGAAGATSLAAGEVLIGFIKQDSTTHDISAQMIVKYHYT